MTMYRPISGTGMISRQASQPVGDALHRQLLPLADDLRGELIPGCGHIIPLDRPDAATALFSPFLTGPVGRHPTASARKPGKLQ